MLSLIVPALYERNEDIVDIVVGNALAELNRHVAEFSEKVLQKLPKVNCVTDHEQY